MPGASRGHVGPFGRPPRPARQRDEKSARPGESIGIEERSVSGTVFGAQGAERVPAGDQYEPVAHEGPPADEHTVTPAPPAPPRHEPEEHLGQETAEYEVEAEFGDEPAKKGEKSDKGGEDVLEETPEFLQDTPDHDRLWFEQRPPRDFDFDG